MRVLLLGATGTIGQAVSHVLLKRGYQVVCPVRKTAGFKGGMREADIRDLLPGADLRFISTDLPAWLDASTLQHERIDLVVSCLASRSGKPSDAWHVDYGIHSKLLKQMIQAGVGQFILLSAICVQKPLLAFQQAKLAFESELIASGITYSIVRPTAFFKSLSGQLRRLREGKPFLLFGDGQLTACKPISDGDLAGFIADCITDIDKQRLILPIGGPGDAITPLQQGEYLFKKLGLPPRFRHVPVALMDTVIHVLALGGMVMPALASKAELAKIGRYYATESMLVWDEVNGRYDAAATPSYGNQSLFDYYDQLISGQAQSSLGNHAMF
ncbi:MAG: NAD-dependent epimerase/dehydratase family protein [Betaproteobacteria bacterium]|nr:NAD-dependent epimerase/dehydratase family protein [Betaproteobacteria bacterium]